jgi:hypothetical protein
MRLEKLRQADLNLLVTFAAIAEEKSITAAASRYCDQPREEIKFTVRATSSSRIQRAFDLLGVARLRLHQYSQPLHLKSTHHSSYRRVSKPHAS